jgi:membrane protein involved in colicin uptake
MSTAVTELLAQVQALPEAEQCELVMLITKGLKKSFSSKQKKQRDPDAPKKELKDDSYMFLVNSKVWPILKKLAEDEEDKDEVKLLRDVSARTQVAKAIWESIKGLSSEERTEKISEVSEEEVSAAFAEWKTLPRPTAEEKKAAREAKKAEKAAKATKPKAEKTASVASKGSKVSKAAEKPKAEKPKAEKPKAEKVKKAKAPAPEPESEDEAEVKAYKWSHNFGKGAVDYERIDVDGTGYLYDMKTKAYLGAYDKKGNKINKAIPDPTA